LLPLRELTFILLFSACNKNRQLPLCSINRRHIWCVTEHIKWYYTVVNDLHYPNDKIRAEILHILSNIHWFVNVIHCCLLHIVGC
jgi:hypothetical protein